MRRASVWVALALLVLVPAGVATARPASDLDGYWVGYYECTKNDREYFVLEIEGGGARLETAAGMERLAGETDGNAFRLHFESWEGEAPRKALPVSLSGELIEEADVLYGEVEGAACTLRGGRGARGTEREAPVAYLVAARAPKPEGLTDSAGLLFKVTDDRRPAGNLTPEDCRRYAEWLLSGERKRVDGKRVHSATRDAQTMAALLGHDLFSWTEEDFASMRTISKNAKRILQGSGEPELVRLANEVKPWHAEPLNWSPTKNRREWMIAKVASYHADAVGPLPEKMERIKQGLYDAVEAGVATEPRDETPEGIAGAWHGYYRCGRAERYLRFHLTSDGDAIAGTFEFGPALEYVGQRGALKMTGTLEAPDRFRLEPQGWIHQPRDITGNSTTTPIGFAGTFDQETGRMAGEVLGTGGECTTFTARRWFPGNRPKNPEGLLFKVVPKQKVNLSIEDCRRFARWAVSGKEISVGGQSFYSHYLDMEAVWEVLGKDEGSWEPADRDKFNRLSGYCARQIRDSMDLGDQDLVREIRTFSPDPFGSPPDNYLSNEWMRYAQVPLVRAEAEELTAARLQEVAALAPVATSLDRVDEILRELDRRRGRLKFLVEERKTEYRETLLAERVALGVRVAEKSAEAFATFAETFQGLQQLLGYYSTEENALARRGATEGAAVLRELYTAENERRARLLWKELIPRHVAVLESELAGVGYEKINAVFALDREREELGGFWTPTGSDALGESYSAYLGTRDRAARAMVARSGKELVQWIQSLPPSATAKSRIADFTQATFRRESIPAEFPELSRAARANIAAYNPHEFVRPDIAGALVAGHWQEVRYRGARNLSYLATIMGLFETACPELPPMRGEASSAHLFLTRAVLEEVDRVMRLEVVMRDIVLATQGYLTGGAAELIAGLSPEGQHDGLILLAGGCEGLAETYVRNFLEYARLSSGSGVLPRMNAPHAWEYVAQK